MYIFLLVVTLVAVSSVLIGCTTIATKANTGSASASADESSQIESTNHYVFYGYVLEIQSAFGGILVKPEDDNLPNELVIHSANMPAVTVGDRVKVEHNGQITLSLPGQIFGATVTLVK